MKELILSGFMLMTLGSCEKSETTNVDPPVADFSYTKKASFPIVATFISTSTGANPIVSYFWNFGDPASGSNNTSTLANPVHEYYTEGVYNVMLTTTNNMGQQDIVTMAVGASLRTGMTDPNDASFTYSLSPSYPYVVTFTNNSTNATSNSWNFGEGITVVNDSAVLHHAYFNPGNYLVTLITTSGGGADTASVNVIIP